MKLHLCVRYLTILFFGLSLFAFSQSSDAAKVVKVKGKKLIINLEGEPAIRGDLFFLLNKSGKKRAIIKIVKVKGEKALAIVGKGKARKGYSLKYRPRKGKKSKMAKKSKMKKTNSSSRTDGDSGSPSGDMYWGVMGGFAQDSMDVKLKNNDGTDRGSASLSGNGFSLKGFFDYDLFNPIWFRSFFGIEQFSAEGGNNCGEEPTFGEACNADIMYLSLDLWGRFVFLEGSFRPWVGGGFAIMFPLSESSTALNESSITNTSVLAAGLGFDYYTSPTFFIPFQLEYGLLPSSDTVEANIIAIRAGAGFSF